jgi:hypothetical protein
MHFWYTGEGTRNTVHVSDLVAFVCDITNWRPGEIARIQDIDTEGPGIFSLKLLFHDCHQHTERLSAPVRYMPYGWRSTIKENVKVYSRHPIPITPGQIQMRDQGKGFEHLVRDYDTFIQEHAGTGKVAHLSPAWLENQYAFLFGELLLSKTNQNMSGSTHNVSTLSCNPALA